VFKFIKFTCPECGSNKLDEVCLGATVYCGIKEISLYDSGEIYLSYNENDEYWDNVQEVEYSCAACGFLLEGIHDLESLKDWLLKNQDVLFRAHIHKWE